MSPLFSFGSSGMGQFPRMILGAHEQRRPPSLSLSLTLSSVALSNFGFALLPLLFIHSYSFGHAMLNCLGLLEERGFRGRLLFILNIAQAGLACNLWGAKKGIQLPGTFFVVPLAVGV